MAASITHQIHHTIHIHFHHQMIIVTTLPLCNKSLGWRQYLFPMFYLEKHWCRVCRSCRYRSVLYIDIPSVSPNTSTWLIPLFPNLVTSFRHILIIVINGSPISRTLFKPCSYIITNNTIPPVYPTYTGHRSTSVILMYYKLLWFCFQPKTPGTFNYTNPFWVTMYFGPILASGITYLVIWCCEDHLIHIIWQKPLIDR